MSSTTTTRRSGEPVNAETESCRSRSSPRGVESRASKRRSSAPGAGAASSTPGSSSSKRRPSSAASARPTSCAKAGFDGVDPALGVEHDDARGRGADDALLVLLQRADLRQPLGQRAVEPRVLVGEARLGQHGRQQRLVLGRERDAAVLVADAERADELAAAAHREERAVAERVQAQQGGRRRRAEGGAAQAQPIVLGERLGQGPRVGIVPLALEEEEGARDDPQGLLDAADDRLHDLLAGPRRREVARDVEQRPAGAVGVVVLDALEHVGDALLHRDEQRREHDARGEGDDVLSRGRHAFEACGRAAS